MLVQSAVDSGRPRARRPRIGIRSTPSARAFRLEAGALMRVRPIGVMKMIDGGETDDKIVAGPVSKLDPTYDSIQKIGDLPAIERERSLSFFRVYKQLPDDPRLSR
jgi:inorganic pyrophosphatase